MAKSDLVYLASPYSHADPQVRQARYQAACRAAAWLIGQGHLVFSPIAHSHGITQHGLPVDWDFWEEHDRRMLVACDRVVVLMLPGWRESLGVQAEVAIARELGKPLAYLSPDLATTSHTLTRLVKEEIG
ncbi:MAG: hypothetical protein KatS3mg109_0613 [Pirellulaceae bacterium]|nr:MAG: hypothetical protein KatS3mg109_0613 [Pirellulaceae bacterium]